MKEDFRKKIRLLGAFTLDQTYIVVQDYKLLAKSQWIKWQHPHRAPFRSQFMSDDSLLGASSRRLNPNSAQIYREDKGKKVINEMFRMSSEVQRVNYQGFGHIFFNYTSNP